MYTNHSKSRHALTKAKSGPNLYYSPFLLTALPSAHMRVRAHTQNTTTREHRYIGMDHPHIYTAHTCIQHTTHYMYTHTNSILHHTNTDTYTHTHIYHIHKQHTQNHTTQTCTTHIAHIAHIHTRPQTHNTAQCKHVHTHSMHTR
jgi:hypothetical protein